jgi:hypothetical protein
LTVPKITIPSDGTGRAINGQRVYTKTAWADEWTLQAGVVCTQCTWSVSPTIPTAKFYYRYGVGVIGNNLFQVHAKFTLPTYGYVKVEFDTFDLTKPVDDPDYETTVTWYGLAVSKEDMPHGTDQTFATVKQESGVQVFEAVGFEYLLDRAYISRGVAKEEDYSPEDLLSCPPFNGRGAGFRTSAVHANLQGVAAGLFFIPPRATTASPSEDPVRWSSLDICEHLCAYHSPRSTSDTLLLPFQFDDVDSVMPTWDAPELDLDGQRVLVALQSLVQRQRGLGFYVTVEPREEDTDIIKVIPYTIRSTTAPVDPVTTFWTQTWAANPHKIDVDLRYVPGVIIREDGSARFDRVRVVGGRVIYCFTGPQYTDQFADGWDASAESDYSAGVSGHADYSGWDASKQKILDSLNLAGPRVKDVFTRYTLNAAVPPQRQHFPPLDNLSTTSTNLSEEMRYWFARPIMPVIPINIGVDYTDADSKFDWDLPTDAPLPLATITIDGTDMAFDMRSGGLGNAEPSDADAAKLAFTCNVVAGQAPREFVLHINGTLPHLVGFGGSAITRDFGDAPGVPVEKITLAIEGDRRTEIIKSTGNTVEAVREKVIDMGDRMRVVVLCKDTIFGIKAETTAAGPASSFDSVAAAKIIRDDRHYLESVATAAIEWYGQDRRAIQWTQRVPMSNLRVGQLLRELQVTDSTTLEVNTVITSITMQSGVVETDNGSGSIDTTWVYETQFGELDFA